MKNLCLQITTAVVVLLVSAILADASALAELQAFESRVQILGDRAEYIHSERCNLMQNCSATCTTPGCASQFHTADGFACSTNYGKSHAISAGEGDGTLIECADQVRSTARSIVRLPATTKDTTDSEAFVCASESLDPTFIANQASGNLSAWQYMGHAQGGIRLYPGAPQDNGASCSAFDSRLRPWYLTAASGPRDVVIIIDKSGSMDDENRMELVKCATNALLDTLTFADYVEVVSFSSSATSHNGGLVQATASNIAGIKGAVSNLEAGGGTYFNSALSKAYSALSSSTKSSNCQKVILFLTDGEPSDSGHIGHIRSIRPASGSSQVSLFTFAMGSGASTGILKQMACDNSGAFAAIADGSNPLEKMSVYYKYLAAGIDDRTVRWTEPYTDAFGMGRMVTASRAVYDRSTAVPILVGVVATDVTITELKSSESALYDLLLERTKPCPTFSLTECQMQLIRQAETGYQCPSPQPSASTCSESIKPTSCSSSLHSGTNSRFCSTSGTTADGEITCCADTTCGASSASLVVATIVVVLGVFVMLA